MKKLMAASLLVLVLTLTACRAPDPKKVLALQDEIATISSMAKLDGTRSQTERDAIEVRSQKAQANVSEVAK